MPLDIKSKSAEVMNQVFEKKYYENLFLPILGKHNMSTASIDQHEFRERQLILMWKDFRAALPDSEEIRRKPFFDIAALCERFK
jgi:hypothetical protein